MILCCDLNAVAEARKFRAQTIARLARFAVTNSIRQDDEEFRGIERLTIAEKFAGKFRANELRAASSRSMHDQHGVRRFSLRIFISLPQGTVMDTQLRQRFATRELEIANRVIAFRRCGIIARADKWDRSKKKCRGKGVSHHCRV